MNTAVRYYSRSGHTKALAEAIAKGAGVTAVSVDREPGGLKESVDVLFIGGGLYAYGLDSHLKAYLSTLDADHVKKAVVFSTAMMSKHAIDLIKKALGAKGIPVGEEAFFAKSNPKPDQLKEAEEFARKYI